MTITLLKPGQSTPVTENLPDGNYFVGRGSAAKIQLAYADVSERHALISVRDGKATVEDLKSANGTFVDGLQIDRRTVLTDESIVQVGGTVLRITRNRPQLRLSRLLLFFLFH
jgi:pSer/pThr/pTyr-binding forkhead associated (FHA) protein